MSVAPSPGREQMAKGGITRMHAASRMLRPFFSSTFSDFTEEREHLTKNVFPQFIKMCEDQSCMFSPIDLRWGITSEQLQDGQVINICLNTVETSRPFFITCLGERYGWQRGPPKGEEGHDEMYQKQLDRGKEAFPWIADYEDRAVTELEIMQAFLHDSEEGREVDTTYMRVYLRKPKPEHARDMKDGEVDENCAQKLAELKERLQNSPVKPIEYETPEELGEYVLDDLSAMLRGLVGVQKQVRQELYDNAPWFQEDSELEYHDFFGAKMSQYAVACDPYLNAFSDHFGYQPGERAFKLGTPLLVSSPAGAGKSTVAATVAAWARERLEEVADGKPVLVLVHHVGCTVQSKSHLAFLRRALGALKMTFSIEKDIPKENEQLVNSFREWMEIAAERGYTLIVLDGVENFNDSGNAHEMTWLTEPPHQNDQWSAKMAVVSNFQLVVTATTGTTQQNALLRRKWRSVPLHQLPETAKIAMSRKFMAARAKTLTQEQLDTIASADQTAEPLFLRAILEELVVFGKFEELDKRIQELLSCPSVVDVYTYKIDRLRQAVDDVDQVTEVLCFMWVSRAGVSAEDLQTLVGMKGDDFERMHFALDGFLMNRTGLLDFVDPKLREAVQVVFLDHRSKVKEYRKRLARYLEQTYQPDEDRYSEVAWQYSQAGDDAKLVGCITNPEAFSMFRSEKHQEDFMLYSRSVGKSASSGSDYSKSAAAAAAAAAAAVA
jgi:nephrocystin-3